MRRQTYSVNLITPSMVILVHYLVIVVIINTTYSIINKK